MCQSFILLSVVCTDHISFSHSSADGRLGCFHFLVTVNGAAVNMALQVLCEHKFLVIFGTHLGIAAIILIPTSQVET